MPQQLYGACFWHRISTRGVLFLQCTTRSIHIIFRFLRFRVLSGNLTPFTAGRFVENFSKYQVKVSIIYILSIIFAVIYLLLY